MSFQALAAQYWSWQPFLQCFAETRRPVAPLTTAGTRVTRVCVHSSDIESGSCRVGCSRVREVMREVCDPALSLVSRT